ncbi:MFS transporter [Ottowia thiooxydans]|uniref:MFS family permease n=1 Tax=Ottowia thiooxydans TaxID=219182 RepID=A0ABV2Q7G5_9BURK
MFNIACDGHVWAERIVAAKGTLGTRCWRQWHGCRRPPAGAVLLMRGSGPSGFFGTWVVRAAFVMAIFGWGVGFYGPPIYLHAVVERTGWPLSTVSAVVTLHFLSGVLVVVNLPKLYARWGLPTIISVGAVVTSVGIWGWAAASEPWHLFVAALGSGMGWVTLGAVSLNAAISPWYRRTRPRALAIAFNGGTFGGVLFSPLWVALIAWQGFLGASVLVGAVMVVVMILLAFLVFTHTPQALGQQPDGPGPSLAARNLATASRPSLPGPQLWRDRAFQTLAVGMAVGLFGHMGLLAHLFSLLAVSFGAQYAGLVLGGLTVCAMLGRTATAHLLTLGWDGRVIAGSGYAIQALGALIFLFADSGHSGLILLAAALIGSGLGNGSYLPPLIAQSDFAAEDVPRVVATTVAISQAGYSLAPLVFGLLLSVSGTGPHTGIGAQSAMFFAVASGVLLAAAGCFFFGRWAPQLALRQ